ncbi:MAG: hypothetical protein K9J28_02815 [Sulfuritalea sp.]|jgi:hypothetical protein|nr:hypothetical protein [Sulfuritalea sp.]
MKKMSKVTPKPTVASAPANKVLATKAPATKTVAKKPVAVKAPAKKPTPTKIVAPKTVASAAKNTVAKPVKLKVEKVKMERDSFTMPKSEYAQFGVLKERLLKLGQPAKKSELLRAGIMQLTAMTDAALKAAMTKVPTIKTGRPNKK